MDAAQWPQGIGMEGSRDTIITGDQSRRPRPEKDKQALNCPRCNSTNTKFCYYNNYSLSQPRYMCKTCRRYWTEGGSLRNVPVGGGSRKNINKKMRSSVPVLPPSSSKKQLPHHHHDLTAPNSFPQSSTASQTSQNPNNKIHQGQDLNLAYPPPPTTGSYKYTPCSSSQISSMELFKYFKKYEIASIYSCGFPMQELIKPPSLNFGVDGYGNLQGLLQESGSSRGSGSTSTSRLFFPFEDLKMQQAAQSSTTTSTNIADHEFYDEKKDSIRGEAGDDDQQAITGYWSSGMLGGGGGSWLA